MIWSRAAFMNSGSFGAAASSANRLTMRWPFSPHAAAVSGARSNRTKPASVRIRRILADFGERIIKVHGRNRDQIRCEGDETGHRETPQIRFSSRDWKTSREELFVR